MSGLRASITCGELSSRLQTASWKCQSPQFWRNSFPGSLITLTLSSVVENWPRSVPRRENTLLENLAFRAEVIKHSWLPLLWKLERFSCCLPSLLSLVLWSCVNNRHPYRCVRSPHHSSLDKFYPLSSKVFGGTPAAVVLGSSSVCPNPLAISAMMALVRHNLQEPLWPLRFLVMLELTFLVHMSMLCSITS